MPSIPSKSFGKIIAGISIRSYLRCSAADNANGARRGCLASIGNPEYSINRSSYLPAPSLVRRIAHILSVDSLKAPNTAWLLDVLVATKKDLLYTYTRLPAACFHIGGHRRVYTPTNHCPVVAADRNRFFLSDDTENTFHAPGTEKKKKKNTLYRATVLSRRVAIRTQIDPFTRYTRLFKRKNEPRKTTALETVSVHTSIPYLGARRRNRREATFAPSR